MHVAMLGNFPADLEHPRGGVEAVAACLAAGLLRSGVELSILRYGAESGESRHAELGCRVVGLPAVWPAGLSFSTITPRAVRRVLDELRPDLVHTQGLAELLGPGDPPAVLTVHGIPHRDALYRAGRSSALAARWRERSLRAALPRYARTIAISPYVVRELELDASTPYSVIPNPIDDRFFEVERKPDAHTVLCVGVIDRRKNAVKLVEAAAQLREAGSPLRYRMAGPWDTSYQPQVMEAIERNGLGGQFEFLGSLDRRQLLDELARCSLLVLPSLQETAPMAIQEAMAAGVPVAAAAVGGIPDMIEHERSGLLFDPHSAREIAWAIESLWQGRALRARLAGAARSHAFAHFRLDAVTAATIELYRDVLGDVG